jgi:dTDP-4-amino-4,6-dideoxygalactose transaminase
VRDAPTKQRIDLLKNFGIKNEHEVVLPGINGKMSELSAALGPEVLACRCRTREAPAGGRHLPVAPGARSIVALRPPANVRDSLQYFVIRIDAQHTGVSRDQLHERLRTCNIVTRKYFYPLCSQYSCYRHLPSAQPDQLPVATRLSTQVLCLPFFGGLTDEDAHRICDAIDWGLGGPSH